MRLNKMLIPVGALAITLGVGGFSAEAAQRGDGQDRGGRQSQGQARERSASPRDQGARQQSARQQGGNQSRDNGRDQRAVRPQENRNNNNGRQAERRDDGRYRQQGRNDYRYNAPRVVAPRYGYVQRGSPYRHYYGSGGGLSVFFGLGSGYRYGCLTTAGSWRPCLIRLRHAPLLR